MRLAERSARLGLLLAPVVLLVACSTPPELAVEDASAPQEDVTTSAPADSGSSDAGDEPATGSGGRGPAAPGRGGGGTDDPDGGGGRVPSPLYIDPITGGDESSLRDDAAKNCEHANLPRDCISLTFPREGDGDSCSVSRTEPPNVREEKIKVGTAVRVFLDCDPGDGGEGPSGGGTGTGGTGPGETGPGETGPGETGPGEGSGTDGSPAGGS